MSDFFFFFFQNNGTYSHSIIQSAFRVVCADKLIQDGYCNLEKYIFARIDKEQMKVDLTRAHSIYAELYKKAYPTPETIEKQWTAFVKEHLPERYQEEPGVYVEGDSDEILTDLDASAIINWVYRACPNATEREKATVELIAPIRRLYRIEELDFVDSILYVKAKVDINIINSFDRFNKDIQNLGQSGHTIYYRGHSDANYILQPSVMRKSGWYRHERDMYNKIRIECPGDFDKCVTHLDYLVHMQHYGLPTRLLDITRNPLIALYFACCHNSQTSGELIVFDVKDADIKYPGSDTVTVLASLPLFEQTVKDDILFHAKDTSITDAEFNKQVDRLLHEVKTEKPAFRDEIHRQDILDCFVVLSEKRNSRIIKQDGAFIICGLYDLRNNPIDRYRYRQGNKTQIFIIRASAKKAILGQLEKFSINKATVYPEIMDVAEFIKSKY